MTRIERIIWLALWAITFGLPLGLILQDWGTPWTDYPIGEEREDVQTFARQFYFGE